MAEKIKRKKVMLTIDEKLEIIKSIDAGTSYTLIAEKYGIVRSTVAKIKKDASKVQASVQVELDGNGLQKSNFKNNETWWE